MSKGAPLCKGFHSLCFWVLWNVTHCYRSCLRRLWLQVYHILQAHELFPWGPRCILDLHGVSWPASTIQFLSSQHPVLENDLLFSLSISKLLLKKCLLFRKTHRSVWQEKTAFKSRKFQRCTYIRIHRRSSQEKQRCLCSCLWNDKEYRKIPNMCSMRQVQRSPVTHTGQGLKPQLPKHGLNLCFAKCEFVIYFQHTVGQMPGVFLCAFLFCFFREFSFERKRINNLFLRILCQTILWFLNGNWHQDICRLGRILIEQHF